MRFLIYELLILADLLPAHFQPAISKNLKRAKIESGQAKTYPAWKIRENVKTEEMKGQQVSKGGKNYLVIFFSSLVQRKAGWWKIHVSPLARPSWHLNYICQAKTEDGERVRDDLRMYLHIPPSLQDRKSITATTCCDSIISFTAFW